MKNPKTPLTRNQMKLERWAKRLYALAACFLLAVTALAVPAFAATNTSGNDMWTVAKNLIVDIYNHIAKISTVLAGLMSAISVIGVKLSSNQHKADQAWDWLKRIWICWAIINGIGAFIAYIVPKFSGLATLTP